MTRASKLFCAALTLLAAAATTAAHATGSRDVALKFVKTIGPGWDNTSSLPNRWMSFVAFSADGRRIVSDAPATPKDSDRSLTIWSFPKGRFVGRMPGGLKAIYPKQRSDVRFADGRLQLVDRASGKVVRSFGMHSAFSSAISPDGRTLAAGYWDIVVLWDVRSGKRIATLRGFGRYVGSLSFRRDSRVLAAGTDVGTVQAWDVRKRKRLFSIDLEGGDVSEPAFNPDGTLMAVGVYGTGTVFLLDVRDGTLLDKKKVSDSGCGSAAFSPDGRYLITPSTGGLITWPYDRGGRIKVFKVVRRRAADTRRGEGG